MTRQTREVEPGSWFTCEDLGDGCSVGAVGGSEAEASAALDALRPAFACLKAEQMMRKQVRP